MTRELSELSQIKKQIFSSERALTAVLPKGFDVNKFMATLWLEVQKTPELAKCDNLLEIAKDVASFGLIIGGAAQQAYLIPYNKKIKDTGEWKMIVQLIIGYKGYITKLEEAGYTIEVELVTKKEVEEGRFEEIRGSDTKIIHRPIREGIRDRDNIALAYCIIKGNGSSPVISVLSKEEIEEMAKTDQYNTTTRQKEKKLGNVWTQNQRLTDYGQMCIKTLIRNCVKKVNLRIANEMSAYEGEKEKEMIDITPNSKTANLESIKFDNGKSLVKESEALSPEEIVEIEKGESKNDN
jgi:phage RecT family recombinase